MSFKLTKKTIQKPAEVKAKQAGGWKISPKAKTSFGAKKDTLPANAPVYLTLRNYAHFACDSVESWPAETLWTLQLQHAAFPSFERAIVQGISAYLESAHAADAEMPQSLQQLSRDHKIYLQCTNLSLPNSNPQQMPFKNYRPAFYNVGTLDDVKALLVLVDGYFRHRATHALAGVDRRNWPALETIDIQVHAATGIDVADAVEAFTMPMKSCHTSDKIFPSNPFETFPPTGHRVLLATMTIEDEATVSVSFQGRTWALQSRFEAAGIPITDSNEHGERARVVIDDEESQSISVASDEARDSLVDLFGPGVLRHHACALRVEGVPVDSTPAYMVLASICSLPNVWRLPSIVSAP